MRTCNREWPERPTHWPDVMTLIQVCQYLHLDDRHETPESARKSLWLLRNRTKLRSIGRISGQILFRLVDVQNWARRMAATGAKQ